VDALGNVTLISISFLALAMHGVAVARDKTDILILKNGDRITGEISKLEYGKLEFKTSDIGTLSVEWTAVATVSSTYSFDVEVVSGEHFFGALTAAPDGRGVVVAAAPRPAELAALDVVRIAQLEKRWIERISGSLAFGYNFTKSSDIKVLSAHFDASYRARATAMGLRADTTSTTSPEEGTLDRLSIAFNYQWLRPKRRFWTGLAAFERNEELGIEGRLQLGGGLGNYFRQNANSEIAGIVGVVQNQEWVTGEASSQASIEGVLAATWRVFRFTKPETSLTSNVTLFPSLTDSHRYRSNANLSLRREIISDFFLDLSVYFDYDSQPPGENPEKDDYGVVTSIGYSF
jgi:hypothetical protein